MKTKFNTYWSLAAAAVVAGLTLTISSCHKDNSTTTSGTVTESQAAQVTLDAVDPSTGGMASQVGSSAALYSSATVSGGTVSSVNGGHLAVDGASRAYTLTCGAVKDSTVSYASVNTTAPAFTYSLTWKNTLTCAVPSTFACNFAGQGTYTGFFFTSSFNSTGSFTLSGLNAATSDYTFNSTYSRTGSSTSLVGAKNTFTHDLTITSSNILYSKADQEIVSGTATVNVKVTSTSGQSWTYGGTLTFEGNHTAKLVLNSGTVYNLAWTVSGS